MAQTRRGLRAPAGSVEPRDIYTVGHGTLPADDFVTLLRQSKIAAIADVRTVPRSRHNPQYEISAMRDWLPNAGISYAHYPDLGGWRKPLPDSPNAALRHPAFRGYADYMLTDAFAEAVDAMLADAADRLTALVCSESVWWRCHRRLIGDYLSLVRGWQVYDLMHDGRADLHRATPGVRRDGSLLYYDLVSA